MPVSEEEHADRSLLEDGEGGIVESVPKHRWLPINIRKTVSFRYIEIDQGKESDWKQDGYDEAKCEGDKYRIHDGGVFEM